MFKILRIKAGFTQKTLAERLGVAQNLVSCWETGKAMPRVLILQDLAAVLDVSVDELINELKAIKKD